MKPASASVGLRIGELAARAGTTPRTIRYYEEIGLLQPGTHRTAGQHRLYNDADVDRVRELLRLKALLGLSLDELKHLVEAEDARAELRQEWHRVGDPRRRREILREAVSHLDRQLALIHRRRDELAALDDELTAKRQRLLARLQPSDARAAGPRVAAIPS